jgi:hypothetical protein
MIRLNRTRALPEIEKTARVKSAPPPSLPLSNFTVMAAVDEYGELTPLCTAGDLLRWCKIAWNAERE